MWYQNFLRPSRSLVIVLLASLVGVVWAAGGKLFVPAASEPAIGDGPEMRSVTVSQLQSGAVRLDSTDPNAPFTSALPEGVPGVWFDDMGRLAVSFRLTDTQGRSVSGLTADNLRFALARLQPGSPGYFGVPGTGESAVWVSYLYRTKSGTAIVDGVQATYEPASAGQLDYDPTGFYTYHFALDVQSATRPDSSEPLWLPEAIHRVALQLDLRDDQDQRILFNPHFDFVFNGSIGEPIGDPALGHRVADESRCNLCHGELVAHGARNQVEYCVICHNPGSVDVEFGSPLDFKVMVHRIHMGRALEQDYRIAGFGGRVHEWSEVGYPQDLRNCTACHSAMDEATPQGAHWNQRPTQQACGSCHVDVDFNDHQGYDFLAEDGTPDNSGCRACHGGASTETSVVNVHWNQQQQHTGNYRFNFLDLDYRADLRRLTLSYSITNPSDGSPYDLREGLGDCIGQVASGAITPSGCRDLEGAPFSRFVIYLASLTLEGANAGIDDYSDHEVREYLWMGTPVGDGSYRLELDLPSDARGTARLLSSGQVQERRVVNAYRYRLAQREGLEISAATAEAVGLDWNWDNRVRVPVANAYREFSVDGSPVNERRQLVSTAKCNNCHGLLGGTGASNTLANAFHRGERSEVDACPVCHTPNLASSTEMADEPIDDAVIPPLLPGSDTRMHQNYEFKTLIHGIHGGEVRVTPFLHGDEDLSGETHYPNLASNCNACHIENSFQFNAGKLGAAVSREEDPMQRHVFSPIAAACMGCHDQESTRMHMGVSGLGGASVGDFTQAEWLAGQVYERCGECHGPGGAEDVARVHRLK